MHKYKEIINTIKIFFKKSVFIIFILILFYIFIEIDWKIFFLKNTEEYDYSGNALSIICGIIIAIPAFILPLFFNVFESKIKNLIANQEFHFKKILERNHIKGFYVSIFIFIIYLFLQNYFTFLNWGNFTYCTNIIFTIGFVIMTYIILNDIVFEETNNMIEKNYEAEKIKSKGRKEEKHLKYYSLIFNDCISSIKNDNKDFFVFIEKYLAKINIDEEYPIYTEDIRQQYDLRGDLNYLISECIKKIYDDDYYFNGILSLPIFFMYIDLKTYYFSCFKLLNNIIWKKNISGSESNYTISNSLENKYYKDIFKNSCDMIYANIKSFRFKINQNKRDNKIFENLVDIQEPLLRNCIYCICESLKTGNRDSIDYFLDLLFNFCKVFEIYYEEDEKYYSFDIRKNFLTYNNYNNIRSENSLIDDFYEKDNYGNKIEKETEKSKYEKFIKKYISNSALKNAVLDISYILFEKLSEKYNEYLKNNKNDKNGNIFILDIIKKIINYKPILDTTEYGNNYYNNSYENIFLNSENILYSLIRLIITDTNLNFSNLYYEYFDLIGFSLDKSLYETLTEINKIHYINNYFIILLLCSDNYYKIQELKNEYRLKEISKYVLLSIKKISSDNIHKLQSRIDKLKNNISNIEYQKYEKYIKNVFNNINKNIFNENKKSIKDFFKKLKLELDKKEEELKKEEKKKENEKFQQEKNQKFEEIKKIIKNSFTEEVETIKFYEKFNLKDKILNLQTNKYKYVFSASGLDKMDFINGINDDNASFNLKHSLCDEFYKAFNSRIFAHLIDSIKDIEKEKNISSKEFIDTYLEKENKDYVIITNSERTENNIIFKTLNEIPLNSGENIKLHSKKYELYFENWINLKWYFKSVDFLPEDTVIIIPKDYISKIELNLESLNIDYKEMENNFITLLFSCFYDVEFNKDKKKDIKIFNIIYEDKND